MFVYIDGLSIYRQVALILMYYSIILLKRRLRTIALLLVLNSFDVTSSMEIEFRSTRKKVFVFISIYLCCLILTTPPQPKCMAFRELFQGLSEINVKLFRDYEKTRWKVVNSIHNRVFNETCLREGLLPLKVYQYINDVIR